MLLQENNQCNQCRTSVMQHNVTWSHRSHPRVDFISFCIIYYFYLFIYSSIDYLLHHVPNMIMSLLFILYHMACHTFEPLTVTFNIIENQQNKCIVNTKKHENALKPDARDSFRMLNIRVTEIVRLFITNILIYLLYMFTSGRRNNIKMGALI